MNVWSPITNTDLDGCNVDGIEDKLLSLRDIINCFGCGLCLTKDNIRGQLIIRFEGEPPHVNNSFYVVVSIKRFANVLGRKAGADTCLWRKGLQLSMKVHI